MAAPATQQHMPRGLPSISTLTDGLPQPMLQQHSPAVPRSSNDPPRDSGTWPDPNSKRKDIELSTAYAAY